jgi:hypothetical protein
MVLLLIAAAGTGLGNEVRDGVAHGSDVVVRVLVGGLAGAALGAGLILGARRIGVAARLGLAGAMAGLLVVFTVGALGATASVSTAPLHPKAPVVSQVEPAAPTGKVPGETLRGGEPGRAALPGWVEALLVVIAIVFMVFVVFGAARAAPLSKLREHGLLRRGQRRAADVVVEDLDVDAAADVFESAASLGDGLDPRAAIIAAYARLLDGLGDVGCARRPYEAPAEHLRRSLVTLGVDAAHMRLVVDKFLVARFSTHPLTEADAVAVRTALREVGTQLRAAVDHGTAVAVPT